MLLALAGGIIFFANQNVAADSVTEPFKVTVTPSKTRVRIQEPFEIKYEIKNITDSNQQFTIISDDLYSASWRTDSPDVRLFPYDNNHPLDIVLAPGEISKKSVKVWILSSVLTNQFSFRIGLNPFVDKERSYSNRMKRPSYWSNAIKITLDESPKEIAPFKIIVTPATNQVHRGEKFKVHLQVKNVTNTNQYFDTMSCGWDFNWITDGFVVGFEPWGCNSNIPEHIGLVPGESWEKDLDLTVNESAGTNKVSFRMGFTPDGMLTPRDPNPEKWKFYWSNFVTMNLVSN